jgi:hypothetical protein
MRMFIKSHIINILKPIMVAALSVKKEGHGVKRKDFIIYLIKN